MDKENRNTIIVIAIVLAIIGGGYFAINTCSGVDPAFTVVESQSMQHSHESEIGIIDTGDMMLVKSPDKMTITSYVEGYSSGYRTFGEYGNVIIYERSGNDHPVIHRAILWLDFVKLDENNNYVWSAPSLENYNDELWNCDNGLHDYNNLTGIFSMYSVGYAGKEVSVNLNDIGTYSGYLTMGDNKDTNWTFDQSSSIISTLVYSDIIRSVAWIEVPWIGCIKLILNDNPNVDTWASNSIPCLFVTILSLIFCLIAINTILNYREYGKYYKGLEKELCESPTPQFPVENEEEK